ncbi:MAG: phosphodiester glycosidase family protein [Phycisphaerales bacterium]
MLTPTDRWALGAGVRLACNANYFGKGQGGAGCADIIGLAVSEGVLISPARVVGGKPDPALVVTRDGRARVGHIDTPKGGEALQAVAGVGEGTLLVSEGKNLGATARVDPLRRHPRTAAGVSDDGRMLWLVVVDGRRADWSVGMTLPELGELMVEAGAWDAVNLDGGGSSAFWYLATSGGAGSGSGRTVRATARSALWRIRSVC